MGHIKKVLAMDRLPARSVTPNMIWTDLCENVHLHYRNVRLDFSEKEFALFRAAIHNLGMAVEHIAEREDYEEGDPNFLIQQMFNEPLQTDSDYYSDRALIEWQRDRTVHFHYRDLRLHFSEQEFIFLGEMFSQARELHSRMNSFDGADFPYKDVKVPMNVTLNIDMVQPYDEGHRPMVFDKDHRDGIEYCKELIREGKKIRPILVSTEGQRLDGFKRYMAHLELGIDKIDCVVDPFGFMGGQNNQSMLADSEETNVCQCGTPAEKKMPAAELAGWECSKCGDWNSNE